MASDYAESPPRARTWRTALAIALIAFLAGLVAMGAILRGWTGGAGWLAAQQPSAVTAAPPQPYALAPQPRLIPVDPVTAETLTARVRDLEERLARISISAEAASGNAARAEGLLVAFAARRALDRGVALGYIEGQLSDRFGLAQPRAVAVVIGSARQPVTLETLQADFAALVPALATNTATDDWWGGFKRELAGLVVVRRVGTPSPAPAERVARAERDLENGQVEKALAEVARMPGAARAEAWMIAARRYITARRALDIIETAAILEPRAGVGAPIS